MAIIDVDDRQSEIDHRSRTWKDVGSLRENKMVYKFFFEKNEGENDFFEDF